MPVHFDTRDRIAVITLDRPEVHNAIDLDLSRELAEAFVRFRDDTGLWVAIVTGAGGEAFSAGADLRALGDYYRSMTPFERRHRSETLPGFGGLTRNLDVWKPIIAAVNGYCFGGGLELALACDIRIAAEDALFGLTETSWGIIPGAGGTQRLPRLVPVGIALEMILTAKKIDAAEAHRIGLVNQIVPSSELMNAAVDMAGRILANAPLAVQTAKMAVWKGLEMPLADGLRLENTLGEPLRQSEDVREGIAAFAAKRKPRFKGQ